MTIGVEHIDLWRGRASETQNVEFKEAGRSTLPPVITATMEQRLVKSDPNALDSRRYARYISAQA
ncbi:hypothetical protein H0X91_34340 [Burkholderia sp. 9777_1386]|uniref:hypothetical protein n=1 Tax=Burkholderia sp. 9777_1386 TaxID=2751183 RepID=UPI0018C41CC0|nr:hypothetical protein [Burkholderia sp. 9777_1386]MBG0875055.1 hypothetical protein [Burkholderia sp. 9777_1386]